MRQLTLRSRSTDTRPRARVDERVDAGVGTRFDPGHGRLMREWLTVSARHATEWEQVADEALRFVRTGVHA